MEVNLLGNSDQKYIENELAECLLKNEIAPQDNFCLILENDRIAIK